MNDIPAPFQDPPLTSPGQVYQQLANEGAEFAAVVGWHMTPRAKAALAILIQEGEDWWRTSNHAKVIASALAILQRLVKANLA